MNNIGKLLINESPLTVLPSLVKLVGLERAVILQQLHYACQQPHSGKVLADGHKYVWNTYEDWHTHHFSFWQPETIRKHFSKLEADGFIISCQPKKSAWDRTKYYRVNYDTLSIRIEAEDDTASKRDEPTASEAEDDTASYTKKRITAEIQQPRRQTKLATDTSLSEAENQCFGRAADFADPPPLAVYREFYPITFLNGEQVDHLTAVTDLAVWRDTLRDWRLSNYRPANVVGLVDKYQQTLKKRQLVTTTTFGNPVVTSDMFDKMEAEYFASLRGN